MKDLTLKKWYQFIIILILLGCKKKDDGGPVYIATNPPTDYYHSSLMCPEIYFQGITNFKTIRFLDAIKEKRNPCEYCYSKLDIDRINMEGTYKEALKDDEADELDDEQYDEGLYPDDKTEIRRFPD